MFTAMAALLLSVAAPPARDDLACVRERVTPAEQAAIGHEVMGDGFGGPGSVALGAAVQACAQERGWDGETAGTMAGFAIATLIGEQSQATLGEAGIRTELIERWFDRQDLEIRTDPERGPAAAESLVLELAASGIPMETLETHGLTIGHYLGVLIMLERIEQGLPLH